MLESPVKQKGLAQGAGNLQHALQAAALLRSSLHRRSQQARATIEERSREREVNQQLESYGEGYMGRTRHHDHVFDERPTDEESEQNMEQGRSEEGFLSPDLSEASQQEDHSDDGEMQSQNVHAQWSPAAHSTVKEKSADTMVMSELLQDSVTPPPENRVLEHTPVTPAHNPTAASILQLGDAAELSAFQRRYSGRLQAANQRHQVAQIRSLEAHPDAVTNSEGGEVSSVAGSQEPSRGSPVGVQTSLQGSTEMQGVSPEVAAVWMVEPDGAFMEDWLSQDDIVTSPKLDSSLTIPEGTSIGHVEGSAGDAVPASAQDDVSDRVQGKEKATAKLKGAVSMQRAREVAAAAKYVERVRSSTPPRYEGEDNNKGKEKIHEGKWSKVKAKVVTSREPPRRNSAIKEEPSEHKQQDIVVADSIMAQGTGISEATARQHTEVKNAETDLGTETPSASEPPEKPATKRVGLALLAEHPPAKASSTGELGTSGRTPAGLVKTASGSSGSRRGLKELSPLRRSLMVKGQYALQQYESQRLFSMMRGFVVWCQRVEAIVDKRRADDPLVQVVAICRQSAVSKVLAMFTRHRLGRLLAVWVMWRRRPGVGVGTLWWMEEARLYGAALSRALWVWRRGHHFEVVLRWVVQAQKDNY